MDPSAVVDGIDSLLNTVVVPREQQNETTLRDPRRRFTEAGAYSADVLRLKKQVRMSSADAGYYTLLTPSRIGGGGAEPKLHFVVWEHLYRCAGPERLLPYDLVAHQAGGPSEALSGISAEQAEQVLPGLMSGEKLLCVALTERDGPIATTASPSGDGWKLTGTKHWVSRAPYADHCLVFALTDQEQHGTGAQRMTAFLIETDAVGFRVEGVTRLLGRCGGEEGTVSLTEVVARPWQVVGEVGAGRDVAAVLERLGVTFTAGRFVGLARWAIERTVEYVRQSSHGPRSLASEPVVRSNLADAAIDIHSARQMALDCATRMEVGAPAVKESAMVKAHVVEACSRVYERCMQVHGGVGLGSDARLFDGWHQARIVLAAGGPSEGLRSTVAERLLDGDLSF